VPRPPGSLRAYSGDAEDDAPTHLYAPASVPPPRTQPRAERPFSPAFQPTPAFSDAGRGTGAGKFLAAGVALAVVGFAIWYVFFGRTGALTVTVAGSGGQPVDNIQILVDGAPVCDKSPCQMPGLSSGVHLLRVSAKGYQETADQAVSIGAGEQATSNITLSPAGMGTGVRVSALGSGLKLYVDGQEVGELPETVKNLTPGDHDIRVAGSDRYETYEEHLKLDDGEMRSIGPLKLRVLKGLATFKAGPGADGAHVLLDGRLVPELPATIEVPAGKQLTLLASKTGYETYRRMVNFDDGVAEKTFEITMVESTTETDTSAPPVEEKSHSSTRSSRAAPKVASTQSTTETSAKQGKAVLNMNSIPVSNVILNGRPLGPTPKIGVRVDPGPQTVVFVHPQLGRKVMSATVTAGETKTFMARLQ
jgi:serine/threonine-protein kinase